MTRPIHTALNSTSRYLPILLLISLVLPGACSAQTSQPITSLPRSSSGTSNTPAPASADPDSDVTPASLVHPITSLPKPKNHSDFFAAPPAAVAEQPPSPAISSEAPSPPPTPTPTAPLSTSATKASPAVHFPQPTSSSNPAPYASSAPPDPQPPPEMNNQPLRAILLPATPSSIQATSVREPFEVHPFSTFALAVKGGFAGFGVDLAVPLARRFNLRTGGSFYSYSGSYNADGITINGEAKFRSGTFSLDWFPFNNGFRISPGLTYYNGNNLNATTSVPPSGMFSLGDANYYSAAYDPISGTASMTFGKRIAPSFTIGFGNMIPRSGRHVSFPFEIGFQYIGKSPQLNLYLGGSACQSPTDPTTCSPVQSNAETQTNLQQEESEINSDITFLRFYPIISQGFAVRF